MKSPRDILEIQEGEALLTEAEAAFPSDRSAKTFELAFDTLNDAIADGHGEGVEAFVANLKYAYSRRVLARLKEIPTRQIDVFFPYVELLFVRAREEFETLCASHPDLATDFEACIERFRPQLEEIVASRR